MSTIEVIRQGTIYEDPHHFSAWPSVCRRSNGELMVVFSGEREHHVCPFGKTVLIRSQDGGNHWSDPEIINHTPLDDRDAGIIETREGTLLLFFFSSRAFADWFERIKEVYQQELSSWQPYIDAITPEMEERYLGSFVRRSEDGGATWGPLIPTPVSAPHGAIQCSDGLLRYLGKGVVAGEAVIASAHSTDDGRSWQLDGKVGRRDLIPELDLDEPHLLELKNGDLVGLMRTNSRDFDQMYLYQTISHDQGKHWSSPEKSNIWGHPPHMLRHSSGRYIVASGHRRPPFGETLSLSENGIAWSHHTLIGESKPRKEENNWTPDLGYPCTAELEDGTLLTVYYQTPAPGIPAQIMGVWWRLLD
ncbi:MAG: exo-alpha-sialidase [Gammaproteobacteria bacterium]|nr:exo-alpha-sialidase [Gammaproteobacteria bacterium]